MCYYFVLLFLELALVVLLLIAVSLTCFRNVLVVPRANRVAVIRFVNLFGMHSKCWGFYPASLWKATLRADTKKSTPSPPPDP